MATTAPTPQNNPGKLTGESAQPVRAQAPVAKAANKKPPTVTGKSVKLDVVRKDIANVEVVDTDFVLTTQSGRKILIRDGALHAVTEEDFSVIFSDEETVTGKTLFNQSQEAAADAGPLKWSSDDLGESSASLIVPAAAVSSVISYKTLGGAALLAAAAVGKKKNDPPPATDDAQKAKDALAAIGKFADDNADSMPLNNNDNFKYVGDKPTLVNYITAGITGVSDSNLIDAINDALATQTVTSATVNTVPKLQALVDAYNLVWSLANGNANATAPRPTADQYTLIGIKGLEPLGAQASAEDVAIQAAKTKLLGDVIDRKTFGDVNTIKEIQALLGSVSAVMDAIKGGTLTVEQLTKLGIEGVTENNIALVIKAIDGTKDDGTEVDTVFEIQNLVNIINGGTDARRALDIIVQYAQANDGVPPNEDTYMAAGVTTPANAKVTNKEAVAFNNALLTQSVTGDSVNSVEKLQSLVDAYRKVFVLADGLPNSADDSKDLTQDEYQRIGANISNLNNNASRLRLLNDIVDGQSFEGVNTIAQINDLIRIANAIQDRATGAASLITLDDLKKIGIRGITADNLDLLLQAVAKEGALGTDTVQEIQNLLNTSLIDSFTFEAISEDTGVSNRDFITNDKTLVFSGNSKAAEGTKLRIILKGTGANGVALDDIVLDGNVINDNGQWEAGKGVALPDGDYTLVMQMYDGIQTLPKTRSFQQHVVVDSQTDTNLSNASIAITALSEDTGINSDFRTTDNTLIYKGTSSAPRGTQVAVKIDGVVYWGAEVKDDGTWSLDNTGQTLSFGNHKVQAFLADRAGNLAASSLEKTVIIDPALLKLESKTTGPIGMSTNLELLFSADVQAGNGEILIEDLTSNAIFAAIDTTDTSQVRFDGRKVIINPNLDLVKGRQYQATIQSGAFKSTTGVNFEGLSDGWTFSAVDPSMTLGFAGTGIDLSDGINKAEFESNNLVVKGEISSINLSAVSNTRITKITFTSADGASKVELTSADPQSNVSGVTWSADGKTWTLANNSSWTSQLATNATYTISAELAADVSSTATTPQTFQSAPVLIDTSVPLLTSITCELLPLSQKQSTLSKGTVAKFTFTFSEDPKASFNENSLDIAQVNGQAVGKILSVTGSGNTRTVILQANDNVTFTSSSTSPALTLKTNGFKDGAGNIGTVQAGLVYPVLTIDTQGPTVSGVQISGVFTRDNGAENTTGTLYAGDKVKVSLTMSENTLVMGVPTFTLVIGNTSRQAKYVSGSGSNVLVFEYTVALGDLDNEGGVTAVGNSLSVGTGRISDLLDNLVSLVDASLGTVSTLPVTAGTNGLIIDAAGASNALLKIQKFADDNTSPFVADYQGTPPTLDDYKNANVKGVTDKNINSINNALATQVITGARIGTVQDLQNLVSAYDEILQLADGVSGPALTKKLPNFLQYGYIGIQGVDSVQASLLGDVIDFKQTTDVDTIPKIQTLVNAVAAVMQQAQDISGLTLDQLTNQLNIRGVTADNFAAIKRAIGDTPDSGSGVDTWQELQDLVSDAAQRASNALSALQTFANENTESAPVTTNNGNYKGTVPRWNTYAETGIGSEPNITDDNLASLITDALATEPVTGDRIQTIADLQNLVTAYASIARLANSSGDTLLNDLPSADAYNLIGVKGFEASTSAASNTKAQLLSDIIDRKRFEDINTIKEIQALADAASAVMANAAGTGSVTVEQLKLLGFDVPSNKIAAVVEAITKTSKDGKDVDTFIELSRLINENLEAVDQAIAQIANFADLNKVSKPTPAGSFEYATTPDIPKPTAATYNTVGITGGTGTVTDAEADAFNDALATLNVTFTSVNTKEKIQALADAYRAVLAAADGSETASVVIPTLQQYKLLGVTGLDEFNLPNYKATHTQAQMDQVVAGRVSLLGDVIDRKSNSDIDTVLEIQALANIITRVMYQAEGVSGLTKADLDQLGIQGVTDDNLSAVLKAIDDTADIGTGVDTFKELQDLVVTPTINKFNTALAFIQKYAEEKTDPTQLGSAQDQPTVQTYLDLGINSVNATNLKSMNSALATASVKARQVPTAQAVRDLVNAYIEILAAADEKPGSTIQEKDYTLLGVDNVVGSKSKVSLLSDVIDLQKSTAVDTADELQALAGIVTAVMNSAAEVAGGLTGPDQLTALGVKGVTADNFDKVLRAIQGTINDGSAVDTVIELQKLVNGEIGKQAAALQLIVTFANANTRSRSLDESTPNYTGPVPTRQDYVDAGITGVVTDADAMSFNDALATSVITGNSVADLNNLNDPTKLQALVDAYRKFFVLADGPDNPTTAAYLTSADCALLGVATSVSGANRLNLLSDIVDRQTRSGVDTIAKINRLAVIANAIQDLAEDQTIARTWSIDDFTLLGIRGVSSANLDDFLKAIKAAVPATTDSVPELQNLLFNSLSVTFTSITEDTGVSTTDFITSDNQLTFKGSSNATDGTTVRISLKLANQSTITTLDAIVRNGAWEVGSGILSDGKYTVSAQLLDGSAPLPKVYAFTQIVEVDKANNDPELLGKTISIDGISNDSGVLGDFKTNDTTLVFSGSTTAAQGSNVGITVDGGPMVYGTVGANNRWEVNNTSQVLSGGDHTVVVYLVDKAGNIVVTGAPKTVSIETGALLATPITEGAIASITPLQLTFNKSVVLGTGNINITDETTNTTVKIPVSDGSVVINGATVTIKPTGSNQLIAGRGYRVTIDAGAFQSAGGETFDGLLGANDWRIQVADPSTTITLGGAGVNASNGINAAELNGLTISGLASSLAWSSVSNPKITKLTFISSDGQGTFSINTNLSVGADRTWTLANDSSWTRQLQSSKTYTVQAQLESNINGTQLSSVFSTNTSVLVDTVAPTTSAVLALATDTGISATDNITRNGVINVSGLESGATWQYSLDSGVSWISPTAGATSFTLVAGTYASNTIRVRQVDAAGNVQTSGFGSNLTPIEVDTLGPKLEVTQTPANLAGDGIINIAERNAGVTLRGTTDAGLSVKVSTGTGTDVTVTANAAGSWTALIPASNLPTTGNVTFTVISSDVAGNTTTVTRTVSVDTIAPNAIKLNAAGSSTDTLYYGAGDFGAVTPKLIAPNVQLANDGDVALITLTMGNIDSQGNDRITYKPTLDDALSLTVNTSRLWTIGGVSGVQLNYTYSASTNSGTFQFSSGASRSSRVFTNEEVKAIESALGFVTSNRTDSSRTFTFSHTDAAGNSNAASGAGTVTLNIDNKPPSKVLFSGTDLQAESGYYNQFANSQSAAVAIAANIKTPPDTDIAKIQLTIGGAGLNTANDSVLFGGPNNNLKFLDLSRDDGDVGWTVGGVAGVDWVYNAAAKTLTFSLSSKAAFKNFEVAALEASLLFQIRNNLSTTEGARTFTFDHIDLAGWSTQTTNSGATKTIVADFKATSAVDLNGNTSEIDRTALAYFNQTLANTGQSVRIADQMGLTSDTDIARISVVVGGENLTLNEDQVLIDGLQDIRLSDTLVSFGGNATIAKSVFGVSWEYNPASKTLTFTKTNGGNFAALEVQTIERNLAFKTTGNTQGDRTFTFAHFDYAGNASDTATATVKVDTFAPLAIDLSATLSGVQNTDTRLMKAANLALGVSVANDMNRANQDEGVVSIQVSANNSTQISSDDRLLFGTASVAFGGSDILASAQSISIGNVGNVIWSYRASDKTLIFRKSDNSAFRANEAQTIERALIFQTSATARAGDRLFTFTHADAAGNVSAPATVTFSTDVRAPLVNLSASSQHVRVIDTTPTTATSIVALGANVSEEDRVASFQIRVRGARAGAAEKLIVGGTEIDAVSASGRVGAVSVAVGSNNASNWSWNYNALSGAFVFTATGVVRGVTADQAAAFLSSLSYRTTTATPGEDVRQFFISATDGMGNTSATEAVSSVVVGNTTPSRSSAAVLDGNDADRLIGDQIVLTFTEPVRVSLVNINTLTVSGGSLGTGATVRAVDSVTVNGEAYATNFLVTTGTTANLNMGQAQTLTLIGLGGGQANFASQGAAVLPTFTLNSQAITLEAWVYADYAAWGATAGSFQRIFDLSTDTGINVGSAPEASVWLGFNSNTGNLAFEYITRNPTDGTRASQGLLATSNSPLPTRSWQHVAATYSGTTATIYLNGQRQVQTGVTSGANPFLSQLPASVLFDNNFIGKSNWIADAGFNGSVFDARVYTRARTAGEIFNDFTGMLDLQDPQLLFQYNFNGNGSNGATNTVAANQAVVTGSRDATLGATNASFALNSTSTSITIAAANVEDAAGNIATGAQRFDLYRKSQTIGTGGRDTVVGTTGNDFIVGQGDNDILTGGAGGDTFAWFLGETGSDTVTDFKVSDGDMVDLSGILAGKNLGLLSDDDALRPFLQLNKLGNDMELRIDVSGASNFAAPTQIITFTNGANNGLDDTLLNLAQSRVINLDNQTSTPLMLDLNGDGVRTTSLTEGNTKFDFDGQGQVVKTGWTDGKDGFLVLDLNKDGKINNGTELFGSGTKLADGQNRAHDGFEALRQYDLNQDNVIDANDAVFANLQVWVDADRDGVSAANELYDLGTVGVRALNLNAVAGQTLDNGNALGLVSTWVSTNGQQHAFVDVFFATSYPLSQTNHAVL